MSAFSLFGCLMQQDLAKDFRDGMRRLASGVSVVTTQNAQGQRFAMTASSVTSVSDAPPSLLVCVNQSAAICPELMLHQRFAVNLLAYDQQQISTDCAGGASGEARFQSGDWLDKSGVPVLTGAQAVFECVVDQLTVYGTHNIIVGKLQSVTLGGAVLDPLVYLNGAYKRLAP